MDESPYTSDDYWDGDQPIPLPFTLKWESEDWTECIYEREQKDIIGDIGRFYISSTSSFIGVLGTMETEDGVSYYYPRGSMDRYLKFELLTSEEMENIKELISTNKEEK
jgi:hypothetical protein